MNPEGGVDAGYLRLLVVPAALLVACGLLRLSTTRLPSCASWCSSKATEGAARSISLQVFRHLHAPEPALSPGAPDRRHDARHRARHRAPCSSLISYSLYSIVPTLIEVAPGAGAAGG
jgi:ATP-binding cassette subfamily B protein